MSGFKAGAWLRAGRIFRSLQGAEMRRFFNAVLKRGIA